MPSFSQHALVLADNYSRWAETRQASVFSWAPSFAPRKTNTAVWLSPEFTSNYALIFVIVPRGVTFGIPPLSGTESASGPRAVGSVETTSAPVDPARSVRKFLDLLVD